MNLREQALREKALRFWDCLVFPLFFGALAACAAHYLLHAPWLVSAMFPGVFVARAVVNASDSTTLDRDCARDMARYFVGLSLVFCVVVAASLTAWTYAGGQRAGYFGYMALVLVGGAALWLFPLAAITPNASTRVRGKQFFTEKQAVRRAQRALPSGDPGILWGPVRIATSSANKHFFAMGTSGSGKTTLFRPLMQQVLPAVPRGEARALVFDLKGEFMSLLSGMGLEIDRHVRTLLPFDLRSYSWDLARDLRTRAEVVHLAEILFPAPKESSGSANFFSRAVGLCFVEVVCSLMALYPGEW